MSNLNLYNIETNYRILVNKLIDSGGEITPELETELSINKEQLESKSQGYAMVIREFEFEEDIIDQEIERLRNLKSAKQKHKAYLKERIQASMELYEISEIKSPLMTISFRKSKSVDIENVDLIPPKFMVIPVVELKPDKTAIKKALESGEIVNGAKIKINNNLQIK